MPGFGSALIKASASRSRISAISTLWSFLVLAFALSWLMSCEAGECFRAQIGNIKIATPELSKTLKTIERRPLPAGLSRQTHRFDFVSRREVGLIHRVEPCPLSGVAFPDRSLLSLSCFRQ